MQNIIIAMNLLAELQRPSSRTLGSFRFQALRFFSLLFITLLIAGCTSDEDKLNALIKKSLRNDATITKAEWDGIEELISSSSSLASFSSGEDLCALIDDIASQLSRSQRNPIDYPPTNPYCGVSDDDPLDNLTYNVYLENSASMDGYMKGLTQFKEALYHMLTEIKGHGNGIEFIFINKDTFQFDSKEINEFIDFLEPSNMRGMGNRGDTELNDIIKKVLTQYETDGNPVVLISDYIFSIKDLKSVDGDLPKAKYTLKLEFQEIVDEDVSVLVIKNQSVFDGNYYDYKNTRHRLNNTRPYYIWIIGPDRVVNTFMEDYYMDQAKGFENYFVITKGSEDEPYFSLLRETEKEGRFGICRDVNNCLQDLTFSSREENILRFSVAVDLSGLSVDESYKLDKDNYEVESFRPDEFTIYDVKPIMEISRNDERFQGSATHFLVLETSKDQLANRDQVIEIKMKNTIPAWVQNSNTLDDSDILEQESLLNKTFGFQYLISGAFEAFNPDVNNTFYWSIPISIRNE